MSDPQLSFRKSANIDRVTDKRKDSLFRLVDTDGSGTIDAQEFAVLYDAIKKDLAEELEKEAELAKEASSAKRRFKMLLLFVAVLVSFLAASVAANFAVIFTVVDQAITTTTTSTGLLEVKGSDVIAKTATATQDVPLMVAPALDLDTLGAVKMLKVKYSDYDEGDVVEAQLSIVAVRKHNSTFVEFVTDVDGEIIEVQNGRAFFTRWPSMSNGLEEPKLYEICSANATCSAFRASGIDVDAAVDLARQSLEEAGFSAEARRLGPSFHTTYCYGFGSGTWTTAMQCGWQWTGAGNPNWKFRGYCLQAGLETNYPGGSIAWDDYVDPSTGATTAAPSISHPAASGDTAYFYWPPKMGGLAKFWFDSWSKYKHVVFIIAGKGSMWYSTWENFCGFGTMVGAANDPTACHGSGLRQNAFKNLVFVFGGSGIIDSGLKPDGTPTYWNGESGWSTNVEDGSTYSGAATAISSYLIDELMSADPDIGGPETSLTCRELYCKLWCPWYKNKDTEQYTDRRALKGQFAATMDDMKERMDYRRGCERRCYEFCPFNAVTEMMIVGFSDGGGLAAYMDYTSNKVSKSVAIDYWAFADYNAWMPIVGTTYKTDINVYTACNSPFFEWGPSALLSQPTDTGAYAKGFVDGTGSDPVADISMGSSVSLTDHTGASSSALTFATPSWPGVTLNIHGLTATPTASDLADSLGTFWTSGQDPHVLGTACGSSMTGDVHMVMYSYGMPTAASEVTAWLSSRRRLSWVEKKDEETMKDYGSKRAPAKKEFGEFAEGNTPDAVKKKVMSDIRATAVEKGADSKAEYKEKEIKKPFSGTPYYLKAKTGKKVYGA